MKTVAVLVCRLDSTRLYAKPMQLIGDKPIIRHLLDRLKMARQLDQIILAIADTPGQHALIDVAKRYGLDYVTGSEKDVLSRIVKGAEHTEADIVIRVGTENPYPYWENLDELIQMQKDTNAAMTVTTGLPLGCHIEVINFSSLKYQMDNNVDEIYHQHLVLYLDDHPEMFKINRVACPPEIRRPDLRLTVDYPEDLILVRKIYEDLNAKGLEEPHRVKDIVELLGARPDLVAINGHFAEPNYRWT